MPQLQPELVRRKQELVQRLESDFSSWREQYQLLSEYILPRQYETIAHRNNLGNRSRQFQRNRRIIDGSGTLAARKLASGMMGGVTSPARPWFRLKTPGFGSRHDEPLEVRRYLDKVQKAILLTMASSNFYTCLSTQYLDLGIFGTSAFIIYEDPQSIIRCYNSPVGEFRIVQDARREVSTFARYITMTVGQIAERFGPDNLSNAALRQYQRGGAALLEEMQIIHLIEPTVVREGLIGQEYPWTEWYFEKSETTGRVLSLSGFEERAHMVPRWELVGNDSYGQSPGMDALGDIIQLQHMQLAKGQMVDMLRRPPVVADVAIKSQGTPALVPGGTTYVPSSSNIGVKPLLTHVPPLQEMTADILDIRNNVRMTFYNDLFDMISQLSTVRSATEIDAREKEKLVLLGPVLERLQAEVLDASVERVLRILERGGLLPDPPSILEDSGGFEITYTSVLAEVQRAFGLGPLERFGQLVGSMAATFPEVLNIYNAEEFLYEYADQSGVPAAVLRSKEEVQAIQQAQQEAEAQQAAVEQQGQLAQSAASLADLDVGTGQQVVEGLLQ